MESVEVYNERVRRAMLNLPGRCDDTTDVSRGFVGWGPHEDYTYKSGRTIEHDDWQAALAAIQNPVREIHDFYFSHHVPSEECACCDGSGVNKDYAELARGFYYRGGGRWAGWGDRELYQNEVDALVDNNRLENAKKGEVTPQNLHKHMRWGHDGINRWILIPLRARNIGIDCNECFDCVGAGFVPVDRAKIQLNIWTFDPLNGTSRVDYVKSVQLDEVEEIRDFLNEVGWEAVKKRFGWPAGDNMYSTIRFAENFTTDTKRSFGARDAHGHKKFGWATPERFRSFAAYKQRWFNCRTDMNLIFDYRVVASDDHHQDNPFADTELPEEFTLQLLITHPRKGVDKVIEVQGCTKGDQQDIEELLLRSFEVHGRHFAWAVDRKFGNEVEADEIHEEPEPESMNFWTGM